MIGNEEFGHDVLNIVNIIKDRLSITLNLDLNAIAQPESCNLIDDDNADDNNQNKRQLSEALATSREDILPDFQLPSIYMMTKKLLLKKQYIVYLKSLLMKVKKKKKI